MIKVEVKKDIIKISGHACYNDYGNDIVCASVSSIATAMINAILNINNKAIEVIDSDVLTIKILSDDSITKKLINVMITLLEDLEKQYPKNIKIK